MRLKVHSSDQSPLRSTRSAPNLAVERNSSSADTARMNLSKSFRQSGTKSAKPVSSECPFSRIYSSFFTFQLEVEALRVLQRESRKRNIYWYTFWSWGQILTLRIALVFPLVGQRVERILFPVHHIIESSTHFQIHRLDILSHPLSPPSPLLVHQMVVQKAMKQVFMKISPISNLLSGDSLSKVTLEDLVKNLTSESPTPKLLYQVLFPLPLLSALIEKVMITYRSFCSATELMACLLDCYKLQEKIRRLRFRPIFVYVFSSHR